MLSFFLFKKPSKDAMSSRAMQTCTPSPSIKLLEAPGLKALPADSDHVYAPMSANMIINRAPRLSLSPPMIMRSASVGDTCTVVHELEATTDQVLEEYRDHDQDDDDVLEENNVCRGTYGRRTVLKFPPPITHLAVTCKLKCQRPWVWERTYKDGRLVIRQVPVIQHEYMQAQRKNGRLTLQLIQKNDYLEDFIKRMEMQKCSEDEKEKEKDQNSTVVLESCELDHKSTDDVEEGKKKTKEVKNVIRVKSMDENCFSSSSIGKSSSMEIMHKTHETVLVECQALCA